MSKRINEEKSNMRDILEQVNHNDGMTVPSGYFEDFAVKMTAMLPEQEWEKAESRVMPRSWWQKSRPYIYLAAMFMGVWCMMKMFDLMRPVSIGPALDNNPVITAAISNDYFFNDYIINEGEMHEYELIEDLYETGYTPDTYYDTDDTEYPNV